MSPRHPTLPPAWIALAVIWGVGVAVVLLGPAFAQLVGGRVDVAEVLREGS